MALRAAYQAFTNPESLMTNYTTEQRANVYALGWLYYRSRIFSRRDGNDWATYLADRELYKRTRLIFNPVPGIVDFYADNVWEKAENENFEALVCNVSDKTDETLTAAIEQVDQWTNWLSEKHKTIRYGAATGNVLIEVIDDLERQKVTQRTVWAGFVTDIDLNDAGDVQSYAIEYDVYDKDLKRDYRFKKIVTKETFSYFRDNRPFVPEGKTAAVEVNPYGFCPAVWIRHIDDGSVYGLPACTNLDKVDEVNSLASHLHDNIHKEIESGKLIGLEDPKSLTVVTGGRSNSDGTVTENDPRLDRVILAAKGNVSVHDLAGLLKLAEAHPYLKEVILSFGADYPELEYRQIIKENGQISGIALERLLTPAQNRLDGVAPAYNQQLIKLRQMQIAIAGWRTRNGWRSLTEQQRKFGAFNLESYERGELDFNLKQSRLVELNEEEELNLLKLKAERAAALKDFVDKREVLQIAGYSEEEAAEIIRRRELEAPAPETGFTLPNREPLQLAE